jgi:hypothetical protein
MPPFVPAATAGHWAVAPAALAGTNLKPLGHGAGTMPDGDTREALKDEGPPLPHTNQWAPLMKALRTRSTTMPVAEARTTPGTLAVPSSNTAAGDTLAADTVAVSL